MSDVEYPAVRVLPKVFADVPSQAELSAARRGRSVMLLLVVLLLGMLLATGAGVVYFEGQARMLPEQISQLEAQVERLQAQVSEGEAAMEQLRVDQEEALEEYALLDRRMKKNADLRDEIRELLAVKPDAAGAFRPALGSEKSATAFDRAPLWTELRAQAENRLDEETAELQAIADTLRAWTPRPGLRPVDPRN